MSTAPPNRDPSIGLAAVGVLVHAGLVLALFVLYVAYVPAAKKTFDEFGLAPPRLTLEIIRVSNWVAAYWWGLVPVFLVFGVVDFGFLVFLSIRSRLTAMLGILIVCLVLASAVAVTTFAIESPRAKLREGLAR